MSKSYIFTNRKDAFDFAWAQHGVMIEVEHIRRGEWCVTLSDEPEDEGFTISEIEKECGVTDDGITLMASLAHVTDDRRVIFPVNTNAALCSATARFLLTKKAKFAGHNQLGNPVYKVA